MFLVRFKKPSTLNFHDISRIFPWFWQPPFWDLQDIYMFLVRSAKSSAEPNLHVIHILFTSFLGEIYMLFIVTVFGNSSEIFT